MMFFIFPILFTALALFFIIFMFILLKNSHTIHDIISHNITILSHHFFIFLLFLLNMWFIIFIIYITKELSWPEKQSIIIVTSLFSPFLIWWWRKQIGGKT